MDAHDLARIEHYRRWLRPDWRRWLRRDLERHVNPAGREAMRKDFALRDLAFETPMARRWREEKEAFEREQEAARTCEGMAALKREQQQRAWEAECAERKLRADVAWERFKAAFMRGDFASRYKAFDPNQPRVPAGNSIQSGRWTTDPQFTRVAASGKLPPTLGHNSGNFDIPPDRPEDSRERTGAIRSAARLLAKIPGLVGRAAALFTIFEGASWLREYQAEIETQLDPPKTLRELQDAVDIDHPGTQKHHIVEQGPAEKEGFPRAQIDASDNLVRIPKQKHQQISDWHSTKNWDEFGGLSPRDWLRGKSWEERRQFGLDALIKFKVLKP